MFGTFYLLCLYRSQDYLGALDGTFVLVTVRTPVQDRYSNRKQQLATNVLGVCDLT